MPHAKDAEIPIEKLRDYLLSPTHVVGRSKARFFMGLGFRQEDWPQLALQLRQLLQGAAISLPPTPHGRKYAVVGSITGPTGKTASIVSVWIIHRGKTIPRFVTAYPGAQP